MILSLGVSECLYPGARSCATQPWVLSPSRPRQPSPHALETTEVAALEQMQQTFRDEVPVVSVINPNQIHGFHKRVKCYVPHALENYKYDAELAIDG